MKVTSTTDAAQEGLSETEETAQETEQVETETEETELSADGEESEEEVQEEAKPKKKGGFQKKLEKQNFLLTEQARKIAELEAKISGKETAQKAVTDKPKIENFDSHTEFTEALLEWKIEQREKEKSEKESQNTRKSEVERIGKAHSDRVAKLKETATDFDELMEEIEVEISPALTEAIVTSDLSAEVQYYLAKNTDELERINKLSYRDVAKAIGKIEFRLEQEKENKPKPKLTKAPEPLKPVGGKAAIVIKKSVFDEDLPFSEYDKLRTAEEQKARKRA